MFHDNDIPKRDMKNARIKVMIPVITPSLKRLARLNDPSSPEKRELRLSPNKSS